jgi:hypothetical protein
MNPKKLIELWVQAFNLGDADTIAEFHTRSAHTCPIKRKASVNEVN